MLEVFFIAYGVLCVLSAIALIKVQSKESLLITTTEFKQFQSNYLIGYMSLIFAEIFCVSTFYPILVSLNLSMDEITDLYIVSICSSAFFNVIAEVIDIGSRRGKCVLATILYFIATLSLFSGNFEFLLLGRIFYGGGSVLLHSAFDAYMVHEHTTKGFPDDWLLHTFGKLAHSMTIAALLSGLSTSLFSMLTLAPSSPPQVQLVKV
jgi:MFS transporter, MFS domain-containing protein family, molybdate-anion transporter